MISPALTTALVLTISLLTSFDSSLLTSFDSVAPRLPADEDLITVDLEALLVNEDDHNILLVLKPREQGQVRRVLTLVIGIEEGRSISVAFHKIETARPLSHDLVKRIIEEYGGTVSSCVITKMEREIFFAELRLKRDGRSITIDSRPSDAIAVALRAGAPIMVRREVMDQHGIDPLKPAEMDKALKT